MNDSISRQIYVWIDTIAQYLLTCEHGRRVLRFYWHVPTENKVVIKKTLIHT
jgi:hypothetical protein